ncbi:MAG: hypothetical protein LBH44_06530 [Treponema sp.]|jgi:hypothetical protein|nr:hypothetical protein [Treponema sp.]
MKRIYMAVVLLLAVSLLSYAQTGDEVVSLLHDIDENRTKYGEKIFSTEEFNFGIPRGRNWLVMWEGSRGQRYPFIYVVDVVSREIKFREFIIGSLSKDRVVPLSRFEDLPGRTMNNGSFQIGDFNGEGFDMWLHFHLGAGGPSVEISGHDPQTGEVILYFDENFDSEYDEGPPVRFIEYKGMQGFMLLRGTGHIVPGGPGWVPDPTPSWVGKWFFYTWDKEQRKFVEIEEVNEDGTEIERPVPDPVVDADIIETVAESQASETIGNSIAQSNAGTSPIPLWLRIAIAGGVVVAGVVVLL